MSNIPEGAQVSDDGQWWWDGTDWQPVEGATTDPATSGQSDQSGESEATEEGQPAAEMGDDEFASMMEAAEGDTFEA